MMLVEYAETGSCTQCYALHSDKIMYVDPKELCWVFSRLGTLNFIFAEHCIIIPNVYFNKV
jgi:hypothetical protein